MRCRGGCRGEGPLGQSIGADGHGNFRVPAPLRPRLLFTGHFSFLLKPIRLCHAGRAHCDCVFHMHFERFLADNVGHLGHGEFHFAIGPRQLRKWILQSADASSGALLRALALGGTGRLQVQNLPRQAWPDLAEHPGRPVRLEFVQVRHAPQEPASPVRRQTGWVWGVGGRFEPLAKSAMRFQAPTARAGWPELGRSKVGRLLLGYRSPIRARAGTDSFGIHPDQRWKRCAGLFNSETWVTDPAAFFQRLHHKSRYRAGRARALLARLSTGLERLAGLGHPGG